MWALRAVRGIQVARMSRGDEETLTVDVMVGCVEGAAGMVHDLIAEVQGMDQITQGITRVIVMVEIRMAMVLGVVTIAVMGARIVEGTGTPLLEGMVLVEVVDRYRK